MVMIMFTEGNMEMIRKRNKIDNSHLVNIILKISLNSILILKNSLLYLLNYSKILNYNILYKSTPIFIYSGERLHIYNL